MLNKEAAYATIKELVQRFDEQVQSYKNTDYNETLTRRDFIDPFFKALGWDVDNSQGYAEAYREVIHEDKIRIGSATKAPDYSFRLPGGARLFFVEAKKPSVVVKDEVLPAYQIRRYAWSAKMPISILTDFEEFSIYDCNKKPRAEDKAAVGRIKYLTYKNYLDEFDFIWNTFSKERVLKGSFDKFVAEKSKKGTTTVDKEFLASLDEWRKQIAQNIALRNESFSEDDLNFVVQQFIDRIIFLRIAEDRGVEEYGNLQKLLKGDNYYHNLFSYFKDADSKYNSGLFDFKKDKLSEKAIIDNRIIKNIIADLYYPISPYEFSVLSVEILGSAYEQFLGKQIKLTAGHRAVIEEKPEVRKAGGVYYTPQFIVDYIVESTVSKLCTGKTPEQISKLKIVDPACGSGSFLIGVYQFLLNWHLYYYKPEFDKQTAIAQNRKEFNEKQRNDAIKQRNKLPLTPDGNLTTALKKQILLNNIYGVDIDTQAVEVTKLSLLLKCMEGETSSSITSEMRFGQRVLPTLDSNIKSGNSLVDTDFYDGQLNFEPGVEKKIKPFSWQQAFPNVFKQNGFDAVIGNPPYIRIQSIVENSPTQVEYFGKKYKSASKGNYDIYVIFIEKALGLINETGKIGFILPHKFFNAQYGESVRKLLSEIRAVEQIVHFGHQQIFDNATTYTCIITLDKNEKRKSFNFIKVDDIEQWRTGTKDLFDKVSFKDLKNEEWNFITGNQQAIFNKLSSVKHTLESVTDRIFQGLKTGADKVFIVKKVSESKKHFIIYSYQSNSEFKLEKDLLHPLIKGGDSRGYIFSKTDLFVIFPYEKNDMGKVSLISEASLRNNFPMIYEYLKHNKSLLQSRDNGKMNTGNWYGFSRNQALDVISTPKIFTPDISPNASFAIDKTGETFFTGGVSGGYGIKVKQGINESYILGLLNSRLLDWFLKQISTPMRGGWYSYEAKFIKNLPIVLPNKTQQALHDEIVKLVNTMLHLQQQKQVSTLPGQLEQLEYHIQHTDNSINQKVYELYEMTHEIKMVEGK